LWVMYLDIGSSSSKTLLHKLGTSMRDFQPPKAVPFQTLPVIS
jgi:hypothetical protein